MRFRLTIALLLTIITVSGCTTGSIQYDPFDVKRVDSVPPPGYELQRGKFLVKTGLQNYNMAITARYMEDERHNFDEAILCFKGAVKAYHLYINRNPDKDRGRVVARIEQAFRFLKRMYVERPIPKERPHPLREIVGRDGLKPSERAAMLALERRLLAEEKELEAEFNRMKKIRWK